MPHNENIERNMKVVEMRDAGYDFNAIALQFTISRQAARQIYLRDKEKYGQEKINSHN